MLLRILRVIGKFEKDTILKTISEIISISPSNKDSNKILPLADIENNADSNKNLPIACTEGNGNSNKNLPVAFTDEIQISTVYSESNEIRYFVLTNEIQVKIIPISFGYDLYFVFDTIDDTIIKKFELCFESITNLSLSIVTFSSKSLKFLLLRDYSDTFKLIEVNAVFYDKALDEMTVSGSDLLLEGNILSIINEGEIKKMVLSFKDPNIFVSPLIKVYSDGRISIIPELETGQTMIILTFLFSNIEFQ
jgi:hypothetical protein